MLNKPEAGITDLFAFSKNDRLVVILCVRRGLQTSASLELDSYLYAIHLDLHSKVNYDDSDIRARYGGKVLDPDGIRPDVTVELQLNNDARLKSRSIEGLPDPTKVRLWTGIRDDPFIFFRFSRTNVVAMVLEIPFSQFPQDQTDWLIWATSSQFGKQIDHVGRSLRTMLPRFDFLNTLPPRDHVKAIRERHTNPGVVQDILATYASPFFGIRSYDFEPDVMILTKRFPIGYPNGRLLTDDVAALCCEQGDCLLLEVSIADAHAEHETRPTTNNVPFLNEFPYLAEPNAESPAAPMPKLRVRTKLILFLVGLAALSVFCLPWLLLWRCKRRLALSSRLLVSKNETTTT